MESRRGHNANLAKCLVWAGVMLFVLGDSTPAYNYIYSYLDSKGIRHIKNVPLKATPSQANSHRTDSIAKATHVSQRISEATPVKITQVVDKQGILHIASASPSPAMEPPAAAQMPPIVQAGKQENAKPPAPNQLTESLPIIPASVSPAGDAGQTGANNADNPGGSAQLASIKVDSRNPQVAEGLSTSLPAAAVSPAHEAQDFSALDQISPAGAYDSLCRMTLFVDQQGKLYIYRSKVETANSSGPQNTMAASEGGADLAAPLAGSDQPKPLVVPAALPLKAISQAELQGDTKRSQVRSAGRIRVYRDGKGLTHIVNSPAAKIHFAAKKPPQPVITRVALAQATSLPQPNLAASAAPPGTTKMYPHCPEGLAPGFSRIVSSLDKAGKLIISNPKVMAPDYPRLATEPTRSSEPAATELEALMAMAAQQYRLPLPLVKAVVKAESGFAPQAVSWKGAMGLMQLMPTTAAHLGVKDPFCPQENIMGGCRYLRNLLDELNGSVPLSLAAYNAGLQRVINSGYQIPAIAETQNFVEKVIAYFFGYLQQASSGRKI